MFQNKIVARREAEYIMLKKEREYHINKIFQLRRKEKETHKKLIFFLQTEEERLRKLKEEEEACKREEAERKKKEEAERLAKLDEILEKLRQLEPELEMKEKLRREALPVPVRTPDTIPRTTEARVEPVPLSTNSSGEFVPRHRRTAISTPAAPPEPDRWSKSDGRSDNRWSDECRDERKSFGASRSSASSSWSSSRTREDERKKKEDAERLAKLADILEKQRQRELELEMKEKLRREALPVPVRTPDTIPRTTEARVKPVRLSTNSSGKFVPRHRRTAISTPAAPPEPDRWSKSDGRSDNRWHDERRDERKSFGASRSSASSSWSSSRTRG